MDDFVIGTDIGNVEVFRISPNGETARVFACELTSDRLARACAAFLEWRAEQGEKPATSEPGG